MGFQWLDVAKRLQSLAQAGLTFSDGRYDRERYEQLRDISIEIMEKFTDGDESQIRDLFASEKGYQTPKVDVRGVVFRDNKILMVREHADNKWALPGGWCEVGLTPRENVIKEVEEEAGLAVSAEKVLAIFDKKCHPHPPDIYAAYKIFILCRETGGDLKPGMETLDVDFFDKDHLPELSVDRNTASQIHHMFSHLENPKQKLLFD
jgi:ADP-ribose pyrophosphatase YjhB (NUDIX family)